MAFTSNAEDGPDPTLAIARRPPPASGCHAPCAPTASPTTPSWTARSRSSSTTGPWTPADVLATYKYQPNRQHCHGQLKAHQAVAPGYFTDPVRVKGLLCCQFFALIVQSLIEREIHNAMKTANTSANTSSIPLYPDLRGCPAPGEERVLEVFAGASHHMSCDRTRRARSRCLRARGRPTHLQVFSLLGSPPLLTPSPARHAHD